MTHRTPAAAEDVGERFLGRERHRQAAYAKPGQHALVGQRQGLRDEQQPARQQHQLASAQQQGSAGRSEVHDGGGLGELVRSVGAASVAGHHKGGLRRCRATPALAWLRRRRSCWWTALHARRHSVGRKPRLVPACGLLLPNCCFVQAGAEAAGGDANLAAEGCGEVDLVGKPGCQGNPGQAVLGIAH